MSTLAGLALRSITAEIIVGRIFGRRFLLEAEESQRIQRELTLFRLYGRPECSHDCQWDIKSKCH